MAPHENAAPCAPTGFECGLKAVYAYAIRGKAARGNDNVNGFDGRTNKKWSVPGIVFKKNRFGSFFY